ncbi:uncharacterized protein [Procambarus clarkii]|uniref:uncharacterized protein n=1 Tax=Procambarus clarkii TaxID=6728 RepID=UPI0037444039
MYNHRGYKLSKRPRFHRSSTCLPSVNTPPPPIAEEKIGETLCLECFRFYAPTKDQVCELQCKNCTNTFPGHYDKKCSKCLNTYCDNVNSPSHCPYCQSSLSRANSAIQGPWRWRTLTYRHTQPECIDIADSDEDEDFKIQRVGRGKRVVISSDEEDSQESDTPAEDFPTPHGSIFPATLASLPATPEREPAGLPVTPEREPAGLPATLLSASPDQPASPPPQGIMDNRRFSSKPSPVDSNAALMSGRDPRLAAHSYLGESVLLQQTRGQLQDESIMGSRNMHAEDQMNPRLPPCSSRRQLQDRLQTPQGICQHPTSCEGVGGTLYTLEKRQHQPFRHQGSGPLPLSTVSQSVAETPRNLHSYNQGARSVVSSTHIESNSSDLVRNSQSNDDLKTHQNVQPSISSQNVDYRHNFSDKYSVEKLLSYHNKHVFRHNYTKKLDRSKVPNFNSFIEFLECLSIAEFPSSWQTDKYIIPSKFKASASESDGAQLQWTRPEDTSQNSCNPADWPSTFEEDNIHYRVKLPLNEPRYIPPPPNILEERAKGLKRKKKWEEVRDKNKVSTTVLSPKSSKKLLNEDTLYSCSANQSKSVKTELKEVGEDVIISNVQCLPDSKELIFDESICKTETFLQEDDSATEYDITKIKNEF